MNEDLKEVLGRFVQQTHNSAGRLATRSGVSKRTILNWLSGRVRKPHQWQNLLRVAVALHLNEAEADRLLQAAGHKTVMELRQAAIEEGDLAILEFWPDTTNAPFQAIVDLPYFVGRETVLSEMRELLTNGRHVTLCSLRGMGGVGKTVLAAHLAYQLRPSFPDGILWAQLDSSDTMSILRSFAGVFGEDVTAYRDVESRAAAVRNILANKQTLIVLDNAQSSAQVRPLLPPSTGETAVIVTTRQDLAVADDMHRILIEPFDPQSSDSRDIFTYFLGMRTIRRWRNELQTIADLLEHLPLAIAIAAGRLATQMLKRDAIRDYLSQLQVANKRLDALVREDRSVRLSFDLSYIGLTPDLQKFFAALGSFGGDDFSITAAAYVTTTTDVTAQEFLQMLINLSLVQSVTARRYRLHALIRDYSIEKQVGSNSQQRMIDFFVTYAQRHTQDPSAMIDEASNVSAAINAAEKIALPDVYVAGVLAIAEFWYVTGNSVTAVPYLQRAIALAEKQGNNKQQAALLANCGSALMFLGDIAAAKETLEKGLILAQKTEDIALQGSLQMKLGSLIGATEGDYEKSAFHLSRALDIGHQLDNKSLQSKAMNGLANIAYEQGDWEQAEAYWQGCLALTDFLPQIDYSLTANLLLNLGVLSLVKGKNARATDYLNRTLQLSRERNFGLASNMALAYLGRVSIEQREYDLANKQLLEALTLGRENENNELIIRALNGLGILTRRQGAYNKSALYLAEALQLAIDSNTVWNEVAVLVEMGELCLSQNEIVEAAAHFSAINAIGHNQNAPELTAHVNYGLARVAAHEGHLEEAVRIGQESLTVFQQLGHMMAQQVMEWLEQLQLVSADNKGG